MASIPAPDFAIKTIQWTLHRPSQANVSAWTGKRTVVVDPWHGKWRAQVELAMAQGETAAAANMAFLAKCRGSINTFKLYATAGSQNSNSGVTVSADAAAGATTLTITGAATALTAGQKITVNDQLLQLTDAVGSKLYFEPPLREAANIGNSVETARPYALVYMASDRQGWGVESWRRFGISFDVEEAVGEPSAATYALFLDFKAGRYFSGGARVALSAMPGYAYTRSGAKGEVNALTGTDRIDDFAANVPGVVPGIGYWSRQSLTNSFLHSQAFDNVAWTKTGGTVAANNATDPAGTTTADTFTRSAISEQHYVNDGAASYTSGATYTFSVFAKKGTNRYVQIYLGATAFAANTHANFDLQDGVTGTSGGGTSSIVSCGNGWYRCIFTATATATSTNVSYLFMVDSATAGPTAAGAGDSSTVYLWQAQVVAGNLPDGGPLIVTTTAAATVGGDALDVSHSLISEDYIVWVTLDVKVAGETIRGLQFVGGASGIYSLQRASNNQWLYYANNNPESISSATTYTTGRMTALGRFRAGKFTLAVRHNGVTAFAPEGAVVSHPVGLTGLRDYTDGLNPKSPIEGIFKRVGTFSDSEISAILADA